MHLEDDTLRRLATPPDVRRLQDGTWLAQRLGLGAGGVAEGEALAALLQKESIHCGRRPLVGALEAASTQAGAMREGLGEMADWMEG